MNRQKAMNIGGVQGLKLAGIGLAVFYVEMAFLCEEVFWFIGMRYILNVIIGAIVLLGMGYYWGTKAGIAIIIKSQSGIGIGILYGLIILITTAFLSSVPGFLFGGMDTLLLYGPMLLIILLGIVPAAIVSIWFGWSIRKKGLAYGPIQWHQL